MDKKIRIGLMACVVIVLGVAVASFFMRHQEAQQAQSKFITEKVQHLTLDDQHIYKDRIAQADKWLQDNPDAKPEDRYNTTMTKGHNLYGLGKLSQAKDTYLRASEIMPENYSAYVALCAVEVDMLDNDSALTHIRKAIELSPKNPDVWIRFIELKRDRFGASNEELNGLYVDAVVKTDNNINLLTSYAQFAEKAGNLQTAYEYWQKAAETNKENSKTYLAEAARVKALIGK